MRLLLVDPSEIFRAGVRAVLAGEQDLQVVDEVPDGRSALASCSRLTPDLVITESRLPDGTGADVVRALRRAHPDVQVVVLSGDADELALRAAVRAGAAGYLLKDDVAAADLADALRTVARGRPSVSPALAPTLLTELATAVGSDVPRPETDGARLTERELEVLRLVARGMTNKAVAEALFLSENTVKNHLRNVLGKLDAHTRTEAVLKATRAGLLPL